VPTKRQQTILATFFLAEDEDTRTIVEAGTPGEHSEATFRLVMNLAGVTRTIASTRARDAGEATDALALRISLSLKPILGTFSQTIDEVAKNLAQDILSDPEFREEMRQLIRDKM